MVITNLQVMLHSLNFFLDSVDGAQDNAEDFSAVYEFSSEIVFDSLGTATAVTFQWLIDNEVCEV